MLACGTQGRKAREAILDLGAFPTPVRFLSRQEGAEIWVKDEGTASPVYGGNKVRKLERILAEASRRGFQGIVTVGTAGSHHVLATSAFAQRSGLRATAVLVPQPWSAHAEEVLRATYALGVHLIPSHPAWVAPRLLHEMIRGAYFVWPGGSSVLGGIGWANAVVELQTQVREGLLPAPNLVVTALGTGGTAAGILAGIVDAELDAQLLGVSVALPAWFARRMTIHLAARILRRLQRPVRLAELRRRLTVTDAYLGAGYGHATEAGEAATAWAESHQLRLDPTYTAKAFAAVLASAGRVDLASASHRPTILFEAPANRPMCVLYWHTLSATLPPDALAGRRDGSTDASGTPSAPEAPAAAVRFLFSLPR